ncbi:MAG: sulfatase-like hydrolase/transferase, partial [Planctomycetales bacterium]
MLRRIPWSVILMTSVGSLVGFVAASSESILSRRAVAARPEVTIPAEPKFEVKPSKLDALTNESLTNKSGCCDPKLNRSSSLTDSKMLADAGPALAAHNMAVAATAQASGKKPNILVLWGDDIGVHNISAYNHGIMGYRTPNIDRIAKEGALFTDSYSQQSCTAGRASFILGQHPFRTGLLTIGMPGSPHGIPDWTPTIADLLKEQGYATGQFGKNH